MKKRLIKYFQKRLEFWKPKRANVAEIAFSSSIAKGDLLEAFLNLKHKIDEVVEIEDMSAVDDDDFTSPSSAMTHLHSALELRSDVMDVTETRIWPPTADDINKAAIDRHVPPLLYNYLVLLL